MSLNTGALPISIGGIVAEFNTAPTTVGTVIVAHSIAVSGFTMLAAKLGQKFGSLNVYRAATGAAAGVDGDDDVQLQCGHAARSPDHRGLGVGGDHSDAGCVNCKQLQRQTAGDCHWCSRCGAGDGGSDRVLSCRRRRQPLRLAVCIRTHHPVLGRCSVAERASNAGSEGGWCEDRRRRRTTGGGRSVSYRRRRKQLQRLGRNARQRMGAVQRARCIAGTGDGDRRRCRRAVFHRVDAAQATPRADTAACAGSHQMRLRSVPQLFH